MIGCYDFCGHYDWTFAWLERQGGETLLRDFWKEAIGEDSQRHAAELIRDERFEGMRKYWGHTLAEEGAGYTVTSTPDAVRIDMHECPSKGFLLRNDLAFSRDYCDHCIGWIGPLMQKAGFVIDHEHNHCGQCWWEVRAAADSTPPSAPGEIASEKDVRLGAAWESPSHDLFCRANSVEQKESAVVKEQIP
jgi:hypothetical protein